MPKCPYCGAEVSSPIHHSSECPSCSRMLHSCKCCSFYSPDAHYGCRESVDEPVWDKEKANHCDYFRLTDKGIGANAADEEKKRKASENLANLFNF